MEAKKWLDRDRQLSHPLAKEHYALAYPCWAAADILLNAAQFAEAESAVQRVLAELGSDEERLAFLAAVPELNQQLEQTNQRWDLVAYCLEEATKRVKDSERPEMSLRLAALYAEGRLGDERRDDAVALWKEVINDAPDSECALTARLRLAGHCRQRYDHLGRRPEERSWLETAIEACEEIVARKPDSPQAAEAFHMLVGMYLDAGEAERAQGYLDRLGACKLPAAQGWYDEDQLRVLTRHLLIPETQVADITASIDRQLTQLGAAEAKRRFLNAVVQASGVLPEEKGERWHVVAHCYEKLLECTSGEERTSAMYELAQVYFYKRVGDDKPEKATALLEQIKSEYADQPWALKAEMAITRYLYHISWDNESRLTIRKQALQLLHEIADKHPGTPEATEALFKLAGYYVTIEDDLENAKAFNLRSPEGEPRGEC